MILCSLFVWLYFVNLAAGFVNIIPPEIARDISLLSKDIATLSRDLSVFTREDVSSLAGNLTAVTRDATTAITRDIATLTGEMAMLARDISALIGNMNIVTVGLNQEITGIGKNTNETKDFAIFTTKTGIYSLAVYFGVRGLSRQDGFSLLTS